jgi:hypothetical protein
LITDYRKELTMVDHAALRVNQSFIIGLLALAFVLDWLWLVGFVALVMLIGTAVPQAALFKRIYRHVLRPAGLVKPDPVQDDPAPHRFAQGMGGVVVLLATLALWLGLPLVGWVLAGIVIFLAALNLFIGFCAGCFVYYQLGLGSKVAE